MTTNQNTDFLRSDKHDEPIASARILSVAALLIGATAVFSQEKKPEPPTRIGKHLLMAESLLEEIAPENTSYRHKNNVVKRKTPESPAECHADCSGLVNWLLLEATGRPSAALELWFHSKRPVARHYVDAIIAEKYFGRVLHLKQCMPGDVVAMKYPAENDNTGHVMLVAERPKKRQPTAPIVADTEQWEVRIIDSTTSPHGSDTRRSTEGKNRGGLGAGLFRIYADAAGVPVGYTWGMSTKSEFRSAKERPIVIGRFKQNGNDDLNDSVKKVAADAFPPEGAIQVGE
jgi:hypothetical protein